MSKHGKCCWCGRDAYSPRALCKKCENKATSWGLHIPLCREYVTIVNDRLVIDDAYYIDPRYDKFIKRKEKWNHSYKQKCDCGKVAIYRVGYCEECYDKMNNPDYNHCSGCLDKECPKYTVDRCPKLYIRRTLNFLERKTCSTNYNSLAIQLQSVQDTTYIESGICRFCGSTVHDGTNICDSCRPKMRCDCGNIILRGSKCSSCYAYINANKTNGRCSKCGRATKNKDGVCYACKVKHVRVDTRLCVKCGKRVASRFGICNECIDK